MRGGDGKREMGRTKKNVNKIVLGENLEQ